MTTKTTVKWYTAKEAKRARVAHLAGHFRLGPTFSKCGKLLGKLVPGYDRGFFNSCAACAIEQNKEIEREKKRFAMEAAAPAAPAKLATPESDKLIAIAPKSQAIGEFIEWLRGTKGIEFATRHHHGDKCEGWDQERCRYNPSSIEYCPVQDGGLMPESFTIEKIVAEFFEIDMMKVERERAALLDSIRSQS